MGLLNPLLLLLAGAAAVPLLLHLLQRHQGPRVIFPALRYLRRAEKESARRIRLRQLLLMLLRIAAVLLLALAAARPFLGFGGTGHSPTAVVIVLDNSMSTAVVEGERRILDELKARALEMLNEAGVDDRFWLIRAGLPDAPALIGDAAATARRVRETEPSAASADIPAAVAHARAVLAAGAEGRAAEIHLLTDLQAGSFAAQLAGDERAPPLVIWHPGTDAPLNRAVTNVEVGGGMAPIAGQRTSIAVTVADNTTGADLVSGAMGASDAQDVDAGDRGDEDAADGREVTVRLTIDERLVAAAAARTGAVALVSIPARPAGVLTGSVEIDADALHADDRRFFAARVQPPPGVVLGSAQTFIDDALEVLAEAGRVRRTPAAPDVAILPAAQGAESYGARTALVILPPASPTELAAANRRLAGAGIPWRYDAPLSGEARFAAEQPDPLLRGLVDARVRQVYPLVRSSENGADSVLVRLSDGTAWAVRGTRSIGGSFVLIASPFTAEASTLPTSALMLPLLDRITGAWSLAQPPRMEATPGEEIALSPGTTAVIRPDGTRDDVTGATSYRFGGEPGVYRILRGDSTTSAFAVNPPAAESDLTRLDGDALDAVLPGWALHVTTSPRAWQRAAFRERLGREIWRPLLLALLAVLIIETLVAASGRGRRASRAGPMAATRDEVQAPARPGTSAAGADAG